MDDALNAALEIRLERQDVTVRRQRHVVILKVLGDVVLDSEILDLTQAHEVQAAQFPRTSISSGELSSLMSPSSPRQRDRAEKGHLRQGHGGHEIRNEGHMVPFSLMDWAALRPLEQGFAERPQRVGVERRGGRGHGGLFRWGKSPSRSGKSDRRKPLCADHVRTSSNRVCAALTASASRNREKAETDPAAGLGYTSRQDAPAPCRIQEPLSYGYPCKLTSSRRGVPRGG